MPKILAVCLILMLALSIPTCALDWKIEGVYNDGLSAGDSTLLTDGLTAPKVIYCASGTVVAATRGSSAWTYETISSCGYFGGFSSAAVGRSGNIGVVFTNSDGATDTLKFATNASGTWAAETVASLGWNTDYSAIDFDSTNTAWVAYSDGSYIPSIKVTKRLGANSWSTPTTISSLGDSTGPSMVIAPDDTIYISFVEAGSGSLIVARRPSGSGWTLETVDSAAVSPASYTSIAINSSGQPAVAYFAAISGTTMPVKYAVRTTNGWQTEQVDSVSSDGDRECGIDIAADGSPWIAYLDSNSFTSTLSIAHKTGSSWTIEPVDLGDMVGYRPSVRLDAWGNPSIAYVDNYNGNVDFASALVPRSLSDVKKLPDGISVRCEGLISSTRTIAGSADFSDRLYAQSTDRTMGIMLYYGSGADQIDRGTSLTVTGVTGRVNGERAIVQPVATPGLVGSEPLPLGMSNAALGGGGFNYTAGTQPTGQKGITGATGLSNIGLLVRVWGLVVETDPATPPTWVKVDDGSGVKVKCLFPSGVKAPSGFVRLNGISSCEDDGSGNLTRLLRVRNSADVQ